MSDMETYKSRFDERGWRVFAGAVAEARGRGQNYVSPEHVIKNLAAWRASFSARCLGASGSRRTPFMPPLRSASRQGPGTPAGGRGWIKASSRC